MGLATPPPYENVNTLQPTITQLEDTAARELPKLLMGISNDTLRPFVDVGKPDLWKYSTAAGHPTLHPMGRERTAGPEHKVEEQWLGFVGSIINSLPDEIKEKLTQLSKLSADEKNSEAFPSYNLWKGLEALVNLGAQAEFFIGFANALSKTENATNEKLLNNELPGIVTGNMVKEAEEMATRLKEDLKKEMNDPRYNDQMATLSDFEALIGDLSKAMRRKT